MNAVAPNPASNDSRATARVRGVLLALLLLFGALLGPFHHHLGVASDDGCAVCTLAHASADTAPAVVAPTVTVVDAGVAFVPATLAPPAAARTVGCSRAPPES